MPAGYKYMEDLLERFFDGETSNEEEKQLYHYFAQPDIPEHLRHYKPVFNYFEKRLEGELKGRTEPFRPVVQTGRKPGSYWITVMVGVVASILILLMVRPLFPGDDDKFNPYEGSYIIRNGERITDINIIKPELEATLQKVLQQEERMNRMLMYLTEPEDQFDLIGQSIANQRESIINAFPDDIKKEVRKIIGM